MDSSREEIIDKIVEDGGPGTVPKLVELLFGDDTEVSEIASEALKKLDSCDAVLKRLDSEIERGERTTGIFYTADLLAEMDCSPKIVDSVKRLLNMVKDEKEAILVHGSLLKLGYIESEKYLVYEFAEDPYMQNSLIDVAIALSSSKNPDVFAMIANKALELHDLVDVLRDMCVSVPSFFDLLPEELKESIGA